MMDRRPLKGKSLLCLPRDYVVVDIETNPAYLNSGLSVYSVSLSIRTDELKKFKTHKEIIEALSTLEYVNHIEEI